MAMGEIINTHPGFSLKRVSVAERHAEQAQRQAVILRARAAM